MQVVEQARGGSTTAGAASSTGGRAAGAAGNVTRRTILPADTRAIA